MKYLSWFGLLIIFFSACEEVEVLQPVPITYELVFDIRLSPDDRSFDETVVFSSSEILSAIDEHLNDEFSMNDIRTIHVEGLAYTLLETNLSLSVVNGFFQASYGDDSLKTLVALENVVLGEILQEQQVMNLQEEGVALLKDALTDILNHTPRGDIVVHARGETFHPLRYMKILLELTLTPVVKQTVEVPGIL